jgi:hypothetical protein
VSAFDETAASIARARKLDGSAPDDGLTTWESQADDAQRAFDRAQALAASTPAYVLGSGAPAEPTLLERQAGATAARTRNAAAASRPALTDDEVATLKLERRTLRGRRSRAQNEADRFGVRADAITAALVAAGVEEAPEPETDLQRALADAERATELAGRYAEVIARISSALARDELSRSGLVNAVRVQIASLTPEEADRVG